MSDPNIPESNGAKNQDAVSIRPQIIDPRSDYAPDNPFNLASTVIDLPLLARMNEVGVDSDTELLPVIIDLNLFYEGAIDRKAAKRIMSSQDRARERVIKMLHNLLGPGRRIYATGNSQRGVDELKTNLSHQYIFAQLSPRNIMELLAQDRSVGEQQIILGGSLTKPGAPAQCAIYRIWYDHPINPLLNRTLRTVKADAAQISFGCTGANIVWAVVDSGIDGTHPHFAKHKNLDLPHPLRHQDFTTAGGSPEEIEKRALTDRFGHGTHVAGIIGGELSAEDIASKPDGHSPTAQEAEGAIVAYSRCVSEDKQVTYVRVKGIKRMSGMAPECKLLSLKALDDNGKGNVSNIITALAYVQQMNGYGRTPQIHGVNLSVGYGYDPEWFACGQSPLCVEVNRLVKMGVVVVVAAGNTGYGTAQSLEGPSRAGFDVTINDPGNADLGITVGSTHREMPHIYGVSYFSSKGPTGDGRDKPDLVAPGEKVLSCASASKQAEIAAKLQPGEPTPLYREESGTSMAAPHVSGVIAGFLSVRTEFVGRPEEVKAIFLAAATDLKRHRHFQGTGLVDLMRAIQSV